MKAEANKYLPFAAFSLLCLIWSSTWVVLKFGLWSLPPFLAAGLRFFIAFLFLSVIAIFQKLNFPRRIKTHFFFLWFGLITFTGNYAFIYWGQQYIASGLASVLFSVMPFYVLFLSVRMLPEDKITWKKFAGVLVGFCGVILIFAHQINLSQIELSSIYGMIAVLIGPFFSALGTVWGKREGRKMHPIVLVTLPMFYASLSFFLLSLLIEQNTHPVFNFYAIFSIVYLALIGTALAFVVFFWMLKNTSAVLMSTITFITPPLALLWGWFVLAENVSLYLLFGMILIFIGIGFIRK